MTDTPRYEANGIGVYEDGRRIGEGDGNSVEVAAQNARYIANALNGSEALVAALTELADYVAGELTALEVPPNDEQSDWPRVHKARAIIASAAPAAEEVGG